jgi:histidinol dehydrogenase
LSNTEDIATRKNSEILILVSSEKRCSKLINEYAPEHLIICSANEAYF